MELHAGPFLAEPRVRSEWRLRAHPRVWATSAALRTLHVGLDLAMVFACYYATYAIITYALGIHLIVPWITSPLVPAFLSVFVVFFMHSVSAYRDRRFITDPSDWLNILIAAGLAVATALVFSILLHVVDVTQISRRLVVGNAVILGFGLLIDRWIMRVIRGRLRRRGLDVRRVLIVGGGAGARRVRDHIRKHPGNGLKCVAALGAKRVRMPAGRSEMARAARAAALPPGSEQVPEELDYSLLARAVRRRAVDEVIVAWPEAPLEQTIPLIVRLDRLHVRVRILHPSFHVLSERLPMRFETVHGEPIVEISAFHGGRLREGFKRLFDFTFGAFALAVSLPLWALIGAVIKLQDGGSVFYRQERVARGGRTFRLWKFRTMIPDAEAKLGELEHLNIRQGPMFKVADDPRCTPFGRWLRRYRLDELPQFLNVMRGEISVVGTRPPLIKEVEQYWPWQTVRLRRWIGITGLWQICGRDDVTFDEVVLFDLYYDRNATFFLDLGIVWKTIGVVLSGRGGY